jgi:CHASE1-domain containing sensor protein
VASVVTVTVNQLAAHAASALATFGAVGVALYFGLDRQRTTRRLAADIANLVAARLEGTLGNLAESVHLFAARREFGDLTIDRNVEGYVVAFS